MKWIGWYNCGISHKSLVVSGIHEKGLHNYFTPCHRKYSGQMGRLGVIQLNCTDRLKGLVEYWQIYNGFPAFWLAVFSIASEYKFSYIYRVRYTLDHFWGNAYVPPPPRKVKRALFLNCGRQFFIPIDILSCGSCDQEKWSKFHGVVWWDDCHPVRTTQHCCSAAPIHFFGCTALSCR